MICKNCKSKNIAWNRNAVRQCIDCRELVVEL